MVVPAERLCRIAVDNIEPGRVADAVPQADLDLDGRQCVGIAEVLDLDGNPPCQRLRPRVAIGLRREVLEAYAAPE